MFLSHSNYVDTTFTMKGFNKWKKIGEKLRKHAESEVHKDSMTMWIGYKQTLFSANIADQLSSQRAVNVAFNRFYITILAKIATLCARQCIPLRGHDERPESNNKGNFIEMFEILESIFSLYQAMRNTHQNLFKMIY